MQEGALHVLNKKIKDWEEVYYAIVPLLKDSQGSGHGDFAYMLHSFATKSDASKVLWCLCVCVYVYECMFATKIDASKVL